MKLRWGGGVAQRPVLCVNKLKKTGARSARAHTRGQNTLVNFIVSFETLFYVPSQASYVPAALELLIFWAYINSYFQTKKTKRVLIKIKSDIFIPDMQL